MLAKSDCRIGFGPPPLCVETLMSAVRWIVALTLLLAFVPGSDEYEFDEYAFGVVGQVQVSEITDVVNDMAATGIAMPVKCAPCASDEVAKTACVPLVCANALLVLSDGRTLAHAAKAQHAMPAGERVGGLVIQPGLHPPKMMPVLT